MVSGRLKIAFELTCYFTGKEDIIRLVEDKDSSAFCCSFQEQKCADSTDEESDGNGGSTTQDVAISVVEVSAF